MRTVNLNRNEISAFAKAPKTIRGIESLSTNQDDIAVTVNTILGAPVLAFSTTDAFTSDRALIGSTDIMLSDGGPKGNLVVSLTPSGVSASTYGNATHVVGLAIDAKGRVTLAAQYALNTSNITEGANLYFTTDRARQSLTSGTGVNYSPISGVIAIDTTVATLTGMQTLTNKTISSPVISGTTTYSGSPGSTYTHDVSGAAVSLAAGATVNFANFSGQIIANDHSSGGVGIYVMGNGSVVTAGSTGTINGTFAYNAGISGYTFTAAAGATRTFAFASTRTRTVA